jgi:hypothetical protein
MAEAGNNQDAKETVEKERIKELVLDLLLLIQPFYDDVGQCQTYQPAQSIPAERTKTLVRIPDNIA